MKILALEFSSQQRSVAIVDDSGVLSKITTDQLKTGPLVLIEQALQQAQIGREEIQRLGIGIGRSRGHVCKARATTSKSLRPPSVYSFCRVRTFSLLGEKREGVVFSRPLRALRAA